MNEFHLNIRNVEIDPPCCVYSTAWIYHHLVIYSYVDEFSWIQYLLIEQGKYEYSCRQMFHLSLVNTYECPYHFIKISEKYHKKFYQSSRCNRYQKYNYIKDRNQLQILKQWCLSFGWTDLSQQNVFNHEMKKILKQVWNANISLAATVSASWIRIFSYSTFQGNRTLFFIHFRGWIMRVHNFLRSHGRNWEETLELDSLSMQSNTVPC